MNFLQTETVISTRTQEKLIQDFMNSRGNFSSFHSAMNVREQEMFRQYLHGLRIKAHSPLLVESTETN